MGPTEARPALNWGPLITVSLVNATLVLVVSISFAGLVFSGELASYLPIGIGLVIGGSIVVCIAQALRSSYPGTIGCAQDKPAAILGVATAGLAAQCLEVGSAEGALSSCLVLIVMTSVITGLFMLFLGIARLGFLVRFIPYPVIGGFLAGTGWLIFAGTFGFVAEPLHLNAIGEQFASLDLVLRWLPAVGFGALLYLAIRRWRSIYLLPGAIVLGVGLFYGAWLLFGGSAQEAMAGRWLIGPFPEGNLWRPLPSVLDLGSVQWSLVAGHTFTAVAVALIATIAVLLSSTGLELATESEVDLDRELRSTGVANLLSAGVGGLVGYNALTLSMLNHRSQVVSRVAGFVVAAVLVVALLAGAQLMAWIPRPVVGGLLFFVALDFLVEWLWDSRKTFSKLDYALVALIVLFIAGFGFLEGVGLGVVVAMLLFVVNYSRIDVVKSELDGTTHRSKVDRPPAETDVLDQRGAQTFIVSLQGFIFFGTANSLLVRVAVRIHDAALPPARFVVLDFRFVSGVDSSAVLSLKRLRQLAAAEGIGLCLSSTTPAIRSNMRAGGLLEDESDDVRVFEDMDRAMEWCEAQLIHEAAVERTREVPVRSLLAPGMGDGERLEQFVSYLERREVAGGELVFEHGASQDGLYFLERGSVSITLPGDDGRTIRLRTLGAGALVGEMAVYNKLPRSAAVIADEDSVLQNLSSESLERMEREAPEAASAFHRFVVRLLAERLSHSNREVRALLA
jgi:sulfate permease, SulP family